MTSHLALKSLHLLGAVLFLGNIIVTAVWKVLADRTRNPAIVASAQRLVTLTDFAFTASGAALLLGTGLAMAPAFGGVPGTPWLSAGMTLFSASGVIWAVVLIPVQVTQARLARGFAGGGEIPERYWKLSRIWIVFGLLATVLPLANLYIMVFKPGA
jgi:uncharacterized membrane protein